VNLNDKYLDIFGNTILLDESIVYILFDESIVYILFDKSTIDTVEVGFK